MIQSLKAYVRWHRTLFYESIGVILFFTALKYLAVGRANVDALIQKTMPYSAVAAGVAAFVALGLQKQFRSFLKAERLTAADTSEIKMAVVLGKTIYMSAWLVFLFYPLKSPFLYDHLVGFAFVVAAISSYSSISAVYYPLFIFDVGLLLVFAGFITALNFNVQETRWMGGAVIVFGIHNLFTGRILSRTTANLFQSQTQMAKSMRMADTANRGKMDFLAMMSHEIRTPMTGVLGMVDFLKETPLSPEQKSCMKTLEQCSQTLLNTLNDVLDTAREEAGSLTIKNTNCDIREVVLAATRSMEHVARKKGLSMEVNIQENVPELMYGDPYRLQQVLFNLLNNAIKFTHKGGIIVTAKLQNGELLFGVTDTGIGMTEEQQLKLFRKFSQADASISQKFGGSGLGLSITKTLVELMGGKIKCISRHRKGTTFYFWVPYRAPVEEEAAAEEETAPGGGSANVLLVEDNQVNQMIAIRYLTKHGHHVVLAENGEAALACLRDGYYDIILMDSNMPGKSGIEITHEIKQMGPPLADIPIVAITANAVQKHIDDCLQAGMVDHIVKPFSSDQLRAVIARHVEKVRSTPQAPQAPPPREQPAAAPAEPLPGKLPIFAEEFGLEYAQALARKSLVEMERLMDVIAARKPRAKPAAIENAAHDLKSISGYIGLSRLQAAAEAVERSAQKSAKLSAKAPAPRELAGLVGRLAEIYREDIPVLKKIAAADLAPQDGDQTISA